MKENKRGPKVIGKVLIDGKEVLIYDEVKGGGMAQNPQWMKLVRWSKAVGEDGDPLPRAEQIRLDKRRDRALLRFYKDLNQVQGGIGAGGSQNFMKFGRDEKVPEDEVQRILASAMKWAGIGSVPAKTFEEFEERTRLFFEDVLRSGEYPLWEKYCLAIGYSSQGVMKWIEGSVRQDERITALCAWSKEIIKSFAGEMVEKGQMPAVPYIFRGKNYYDLVDTKTVHHTQDIGRIEASSPDELHKKYLEQSGLDESI